MFSPFHRNSVRATGALTALLLASCILPASAWALQPSAAQVAQADLEVAEARLAVAEARRNVLKAGGQSAATQAPAAPAKAAASAFAPQPGVTGAAAPARQTTPPLDEGGDGETTTGDQSGEGGDTRENGGNGNGAGVTNSEVNEGRKEFGGLEFGVGISFTADVGKNDRVTEAELVNGLVRVKDEDNGRARIMLESHYFFKPCQQPSGQPMLKKNCSLPFGLVGGDFGFGPFIALQPGTEEIIQAVAIGGMVGFRRPGTGTESFNLGLGLVIDPNTRILGDGIVADMPLPEGETAIRYKEKMQTGVLVLASFGF